MFYINSGTATPTEEAGEEGVVVGDCPEGRRAGGRRRQHRRSGADGARCDDAVIGGAGIAIVFAGLLFVLDGPARELAMDESIGRLFCQVNVPTNCNIIVKIFCQHPIPSLQPLHQNHQTT